MPRVAPAIALDPPTQAALERLARAPSTSQALALRARLVLAAAAGNSNQQIAATFNLTPNTVGKWRTKFALYGLDGLTDDPRSGRPRKYGAWIRGELNTLLCQPPPEGKERWTVDDLARRLRVSRSSLHAMLVAGDLMYRRRRASPRPRR